MVFVVKTYARQDCLIESAFLSLLQPFSDYAQLAASLVK